MAKEQIGIAGEFWFYSQLQRLGYKAYITLGNTKSVDIAIQLNNNRTLTFDVKSKANFGGSFMYLPKNVRDKNHFFVFVNLAVNSKNKKTEILSYPNCYIVNSLNLDKIAFDWNAKSSNAKGFGFQAKYLWYLKRKSDKSITQNNIANFKTKHRIKDAIDFKFYDKIILTLKDFEDKYYLKK